MKVSNIQLIKPKGACKL